LDVERFLKEKAALIDDVIEKYIPRNFSENATVFDLNPPNYAHNLEALNNAVSKPIWELLDRGGKRWRPSLFLLICEALGRNSDDFVDYAIIPEIVHNGTFGISKGKIMHLQNLRLRHSHKRWKCHVLFAAPITN
jgi:geranylgeranyl pyrophosphate synthase